MKKITKPPKYVMLHTSALRFVKNDSVYAFSNNDEPSYYRDAGNWGVAFRWEGDKLFSVSDVKWLNNIELIPTTKEIYNKDNAGYI